MILNKREAILVKQSLIKRGCVKTKPGYPIVSCRGRVYLLKDTKQTVLGERASSLRTKRQHYPRSDTPLYTKRFCYSLLLKYFIN